MLFYDLSNFRYSGSQINMKRTLLTSALLFVSVWAAAAAKQYSVTFPTAVRVGSQTLAAGEYKIKVNGSNAIFIDARQKSITAPAKVEKVEKKSPYTAAETKDVDGGTRLDALDLEGENFKLVF